MGRVGTILTNSSESKAVLRESFNIVPTCGVFLEIAQIDRFIIIKFFIDVAIIFELSGFGILRC